MEVDLGQVCSGSLQFLLQNTRSQSSDFEHLEKGHTKVQEHGLVDQKRGWVKCQASLKQSSSANLISLNLCLSSKPEQEHADNGEGGDEGNQEAAAGLLGPDAFFRLSDKNHPHKLFWQAIDVGNRKKLELNPQEEVKN